MNNLQLKRWGLLPVYSSFENQWIARCKFLPSFSGMGPDMLESITSFVMEMPKKDAWLEVAHIMLGSALQGNFQNLKESYFKSPDLLWTNIVDNAFIPAYSEVKNEEVINRVYAFSEWCLAVDPLTKDLVAGGLRSAVHVCFYEAIPSAPHALQDLPNWFSFEEIQKSFLSNPFLREDYDALKTAFGKSN